CSKLLLRNCHRYAAARESRDAINDESMLREDHFVAGTHVGTGEQRKQFLRAAAADNPLRIEPVKLRDGVAKNECAAVRIGGQVVSRTLVGGNGFRTRTKSRLVGRKLESRLLLRRRRAPRNIRF